MTRFSKRELNSVTTRIAFDVMEALQRTLGKRIWNLSETNRHKLYRLYIWSQRYKVSYDYMLSVLVPYFSRGVEKRTGKKSSGLGVSIPVLTGDVAEEILQKAIARDFTESENESEWREEKKEEIENLVNPTDFKIRVKKPLQFKTINEEVKAYKASVGRVRKKDSKLEAKFRKIPYRGNPFR